MAKGIFARLLTVVAVLSTSVMVMAQGDEGLMPLRTHSMYMPYIGKALILFSSPISEMFALSHLDQHV